MKLILTTNGPRNFYKRIVAGFIWVVTWRKNIGLKAKFPCLRDQRLGRYAGLSLASLDFFCGGIFTWILLIACTLLLMHLLKIKWFTLLVEDICQLGYKNDKQLSVILSFPHLDLVWDNDPGKSAYFGDPNHASGEIFLKSWWDLRMEGYQSHLAFTLNFLMSAWTEITLNILHPFVLGS